MQVKTNQLTIQSENIRFNVSKNFEEFTEFPPVLLLHGFTGNLKVWDNIRDKISYPSIAIDLPGHGQSTILNYSTKYSFDDWNRDLKFILDKLQISKINLCGYSMGGRLALSFAINHSDRIHSLILESTSPGISDLIERENRYKIDLQLVDKIDSNFKLFLSDWAKLPFFEYQQSRNPSEWQKLVEIRKSSNPKGLVYSLRNLSVGNQPSYWDSLQKIDFPVLLITGSEDNKYNKIAKQMSQQIQCTYPINIPNSGHTTHLEKLDTFVGVVKNFLKIR